MTWAEKKLKECNLSDDLITLENPDTIKALDEKISLEFYPKIIEYLRKSQLPYYPSSDEELKISSVNDIGRLARKFRFMLDDTVGYPILICDFQITRTSYFFNRQFNLCLPENIRPDFIFQLLNDERFKGTPPELTIHDYAETRPEWNAFFHINYEAGSGLEFGGYSLFNTSIELIEETINSSIAMFETAGIEGIIYKEQVSDFLDIAVKCFGS